MFDLCNPIVLGKPKPNNKPFDIDGNTKRDWVDAIAKTKKRMYQGDYELRNLSETYESGQHKLDFVKRMKAYAITEFFNAHKFRYAAKSNVNHNPNALHQHPKYEHACAV